MFRFFFGSLYRNGHFSGDPHPGNYKLMDDGRVAFIDFGMTKRVDRADLEAEITALRFLMDGDVEGVHRTLGAMGFYDPADEQVEAEAVFDHFHDVTRWYTDDGEVTVDRELVTQVLIDFGDPRSRHWQLMRRETMPPQAMLARRMEALTLGVLGQLGATANWHLIAREWLFGDPPSTELGALEHPFHGRGRLASRVGCRHHAAPLRRIPDDARQGQPQGGGRAERSRPGDGPPDRGPRRAGARATSSASAPATPTARCCARSSGSSSRPRRRRPSTAACSSSSAATRRRRSSC